MAKSVLPPQASTSNRDPLLNLQQISVIYGLPRTTMNDFIKRGDLPFIKIGDCRRVWIRQSDVEALISRSAVRFDRTGALVATR